MPTSPPSSTTPRAESLGDTNGLLEIGSTSQPRPEPSSSYPTKKLDISIGSSPGISYTPTESLRDAKARVDSGYSPAPETAYNPTFISSTQKFSYYFSPGISYQEPRRCYMCLGSLEESSYSSERCRCRG
jgi:hypothetical protein